MSRVARSARVGSRQRTETINSSKTLAKAESGEVYICSGSAHITLTMPKPEEGQYFKFIYGHGMEMNLKLEADASGHFFAGNILQLGALASAATDAPVSIVIANGSSHDEILITGPANPGDYLEVVSDGTTWYASGVVSGSVAFGT